MPRTHWKIAARSQYHLQVPSAPGLVDPHLPFLSPWLRLSLVIRQIRAPRPGTPRRGHDEGDAQGRAVAAGADAAVRVVELSMSRTRSARSATTIAPLVTIALVVVLTACATLSGRLPETQVVNVEQVVGVWDGLAAGRGGMTPTFPVQLSIEPDGRYTWVTTYYGMSHGNLRVIDGVPRYGGLFPRGWDWAGTVTMVDEAGKEHLIWRRNDGALLAEFSGKK